MYQSLEAELHDLFWEAEGPSAELPLLRKFLAHHPGKTLELGCGSGRLLLPLVKEGFDIEGLDNSPEMIRLAQDNAKEQLLNPALHCCDLSALNPGLSYQAIAIPAFTLQLLSDPITTVRRISELVPSGGGLYFSVFYPWAELQGDLPEDEFYPDHSLTLPDGNQAKLFTKHSLDREAQILTRSHHYQLLSRGETIREHRSTQIIRYCEEEDWQHLLDACGFRVQKTFRDFQLENIGDDETTGVTTFLAVRR